VFIVGGRVCCVFVFVWFLVFVCVVCVVGGCGFFGCVWGFGWCFCVVLGCLFFGFVGCGGGCGWGCWGVG
ncbi:hypothetical protein RA279_27910, partial [Pseudomonas syringae pv. tagetis]|uniref:hypothetical protein n=1 Tax=Pseudomonas syringae group genomosp. 7 TaxID=251699 RepID=UPI0037706500